MVIMMEKMIVIGLLILLLIVLIVLIFVMVLNNSKRNNEEIEKLRKQVSDDLLAFQNGLMQAIHMDMNTLNENTSSKMIKMEHNVNEQLHSNLTTTSRAFSEVLKQVVQMNEAQSQLKELGNDISSLHRILNDKKTRGIYGEIELYTLLESAFGDNQQRYAKQYKLSNDKIVDAILFGNDAMGNIPIDSKFPLEHFNRLQDSELNASQRNVLVNEFKNDVKKHIQTIADKYIIANETSEFAYMFIPAEAIFAYINANLPEVIQYSYEKKVYIVSPTTLMAYITAIKALYLGQKKNEKMKEIQEELVRLSIDFNRFIKRYESVENDYERTYKDMKDVLISANKIANRFKKIEAVELDDQIDG